MTNPRRAVDPAVVLAAHMSRGWTLHEGQLWPPGRRRHPDAKTEDLRNHRQAGHHSSLLCDNGVSSTAGASEEAERGLTGSGSRGSEEERTHAVETLCDALGLSLPGAPSGTTNKRLGGGGTSRDLSEGGSGGGVAMALGELVGATTAARLAGTVLLRADWCRSALMEAERQVGARE